MEKTGCFHNLTTKDWEDIARARLNDLESDGSYDKLSPKNKQKALTYMKEGGIQSMHKLIDLYELESNA